MSGEEPPYTYILCVLACWYYISCWLRYLLPSSIYTITITTYILSYLHTIIMVLQILFPQIKILHAVLKTFYLCNLHGGYHQFWLRVGLIHTYPITY